MSQQLESCVFRCSDFGCCTFLFLLHHRGNMNSADNITIEYVKQNIAFKNIKAYLECNKQGVSEQILNEYLPVIINISKTYYKKHKIDLDDIIAEGLFALAKRFKDYPYTLHFESYSRENVYKYIRRHIIKYCETQIKTEMLEKQKIERCIKYNVKA